MPNRPRKTPDRRLLRCDQCGRTVVCTHADLMRHTRDGWPKCCGRVMALFTEAPVPQDPPPAGGA